MSEGNSSNPMSRSIGSSTARLTDAKTMSTTAPSDRGRGIITNADRSASLSAWASSLPAGWAWKNGSGWAR